MAQSLDTYIYLSMGSEKDKASKTVYKMVIFLPIYSHETPHSSPARVRYGVPFVSSMSDLYLIFGIVKLREISRCIRPCFIKRFKYTSVPNWT